MLRRNSCECKSSNPCENPRLDNIFLKNEERRDTCAFTTSNPIQSDNERQFTKLAKQKNRMKNIQIDGYSSTQMKERILPRQKLHCQI